ncbi:hypothetical protein G3O06_15915 [Burkholderia sp. Ac-20345]|uniref:hypothetical protein n=1 Tax=Burkholderia sp. Ac-20345 TaxID=2703891 RepID=UPI00197CAD88|nr:hypothetical protein [Burkholderia sp. Ac-20345]MBN3779024.1 hypothetical protein [Burkholderia sp. Ac-20345]
MHANLWWKYVLIEEVAKTICDTHFIAAGWNADQAGFEQGVESTSFGLCTVRYADINDRTASTRCFPDLYVWRGGKAGFFIEVRSVGDTVPDEELGALIQHVLNQYNSVFVRQGRRLTCGSHEAGVSAEGGGGSDRVTRGRSGSDGLSNHDEVDLLVSDWPSTLLFYVIGKSTSSGSFVYLFHPNADEACETAYAASSIHDASLDGNCAQDVTRLVADLRLAWRDSIQPGLECVFQRGGESDV